MNRHNVRLLVFSIWMAVTGASVVAADAIENRAIDAGSEEKALNESWNVASDARINVENVRGTVTVRYAAEGPEPAGTTSAAVPAGT